MKLKKYFIKINSFLLLVLELCKICIIKFFKTPYKYQPKWHLIRNGKLKDRYFYIDLYDGLWQKDMLEGDYDKFFFNYIKKLDFSNKVIFDIGAHIGYHSLMFAEIVGKNGKVFAFEPNIFNIKRMKVILNKNQDLKKRIRICEVAISNNSGKTEFNFSAKIDNGQSSGGYVKGAYAPGAWFYFKIMGFKKKLVKTTHLDNIMKELKIKDIPSLIKIDVEGAENLVLEGGRKFINKYKPTILVEIHSTYNMVQLRQFFKDMQYSIKVLNQSSNERCFVAVIPIKNTKQIG